MCWAHLDSSIQVDIAGKPVKLVLLRFLMVINSRYWDHQDVNKNGSKWRGNKGIFVQYRTEFVPIGKAY